MILSGCGAVQQQRLGEEARSITDQCRATILANAASGVIANRTAIDARDITPSMVADRSLPTANEIAAVKELEPLVSGCQRKIVEFVEASAPVAASIFETARVAYVEITAVFEQGSMPWGEYNRLKLETYTLSLQASQRAEMQARAIDAAQRQAAAAEIANIIGALQGIVTSLRTNKPHQQNAPPRPGVR